MKTLDRANQKRPIHLGVVGATGVVGETFLLLLDERNFPIGNLKLFASDQSAGQTRTVAGRDHKVEALKPGCFDGLDLVFFSSGDDISREWAPQAVRSGAFAVDNSAAFRMDPEVPLAVPEVNGHRLPILTTAEIENRTFQPTIIANPNCSTIQLVVALKPLAERYGLEHVRVASYQSVSGAGRSGLEELLGQTQVAIKGDQPKTGSTFPKPIAFDCIPQIGTVQANSELPFFGFTTEEIKVMRETKKILELPELKASAFTVRVPTINSHAEAVWCTLKSQPQSVDEVESVLEIQRGVSIFRTKDGIDYPTQAFASGQDPVYVGRVHFDEEDPKTVLMWVVSDNLRKGAALNGIQIAEVVFGLC